MIDKHLCRQKNCEDFTQNSACQGIVQKSESRASLGATDAVAVKCQDAKSIGRQPLPSVSVNIEHTKKHYKLLQHAGNGATELRVFGPAFPNGRSVFPWGEVELLNLAKELNRNSSVYVGINQRSGHGKNSVSVMYWNCVPFDIEDSEHSLAGQPFALALARRVQVLLKKKGIVSAITLSVRGCYLLIFFREPIPVYEPEARVLFEERLRKLKAFAATQKSEKAHCDTAVYDAARLVKLIGTRDHRTRTMTRWVDEPQAADNNAVLEWVDSLPAPEPVFVMKRAISRETPRRCALLEFACEHELPGGGRHAYLDSNMLVYGSSEKIEKYCRVQSKPLRDVIGWEDYPGWEKTFNCASLRKYAEKNNLGHLCSLCLMEETVDA